MHEGRAEGLGLMEQSLENLRAIEGRASYRRWVSEFAVLLARAGRIDDGLVLLAREIDLKTSAHFWDAELFRMKGELLRLRGSQSDPADAEACFEQAIQVAVQLRAKSLELRAGSSLARLWHAQGKSRDAVARLSPVYNWFTEGFETADLAEARRLIKM
jgi:predicted ATPase